MAMASRIFYKIDMGVLHVFERSAHKLQMAYGWTSFTLTHICLTFFVCAGFSAAFVTYWHTQNILIGFLIMFFRIFVTIFMALFVWACSSKCKRVYVAKGLCSVSDNPLLNHYRYVRAFLFMIVTPLFIVDLLLLILDYSGNVTLIYTEIERGALVGGLYFASCIPLPRYVTSVEKP